MNIVLQRKKAQHRVVWACDPEGENPLATTYTGTAEPHQRQSETVLAVGCEGWNVVRCEVMSVFMTIRRRCVKWGHHPILSRSAQRRSTKGQDGQRRVQ